MDEKLKRWVDNQVHLCAETIGYDLEMVPEEERTHVLADYAADQLYGRSGPEAEAFRALEPETKRQWINEAAEEYAL